MDWKALGKAVTRRRVQLGYPTLVSFSEAARFSTRLLGDLEAGRRPSYDPATLARIERTLAWPPGAVDAILDGGPEPPPSLLVGNPSQPLPFHVTFNGTPTDAPLTLGRQVDAWLHPDSSLSPRGRDHLRKLITAAVYLAEQEALAATDRSGPPFDAIPQAPEPHDLTPSSDIRGSARR